MNDILVVFLLTLTPFLELRASIPYGILTNNSWVLVYFIALFTNILLGFFIYLFFDILVKFITKIKFIKKIYTIHVLKTQKKIKKYIHQYGVIGLAIFIGIPLPGSGVYSGALAAYSLGMTKKDYFISMAMGVFIAATLVTIIVLSGTTAFFWLIK